MSDARRRLLNEMGIVVWRRRGAPPPRLGTDLRSGLLAPDADVSPGGPGTHGTVTGMSWPELARAVAACTACDLHRTRTRTVFGVGASDADLLVIGEAPGEQEDLQGEPFVGRAGQLLNAMLRAIGLEREQVYIANTLKCRPPRNRDPDPNETERCAPFLDRQIVLVRPRVILAVGRIAAQTLLASDVPLGRLRGRPHRYRGGDLPLVVTYHPAYLLRSPLHKRNAWQDLRLVRRLLAPEGDTAGGASAAAKETGRP